MKEEFPKALHAVLAHEGGWANHPKDPGGATMKGVTQRVYDASRDRAGLPRQSVRLISKDEIHAIYKRQYWDAIKGDDLPAGVAYAVFDFAVNSGPGRAAKSLQRALGLTADGMVGMATVAAANAHPDHDALIEGISRDRQRFYEALPTFRHFGRGWSRRNEEVRKRGQAWASGSVGPATVAVEGGDKKAPPQGGKARPGTGPADAAIAVGTGSGGIAGTLQGTREQLEPLAGTSSWVGTVVAILTIASAALVIGGGLWRWYQARRAAEFDEAMG
jgi:lysozyme family protein